MASPESAPSTPPSDSIESTAPAESSSNSTSSPGSPPPNPPSSPPPSPPVSSSPPPAEKSPPSSPPPSSPPPSSPSPSPPPAQTSPPPKDSSSSPPPSSPSPSPPAPDSSSSGSPPPGSSPPTSAGSPPPTSSSPPPPATVAPPTNDGQPSPVFSPPPPGAISDSTPPPPSEKVVPSPPSHSSNNNNNNNSKSPSPPTPSRSSHNNNNSPGSSGGDGDSGGGSSASPSPNSSSDSTVIIVGVILGGFLIVAVIAFCIFCKMRKKKQRYYLDTARPPKPGDQYYSGSTPAQWNNPQTMDHVVKLPPPPGGMGAPSPLVGGGGGWGGAGSTPHGGLSSSAEFSSGFSGQHHPHMTPASPHVGGMAGGLGFSKSQFSYEELAEATSGFSQANLLGQGGFGFVHKGILPDGKEVAVKSLKLGSGQGEREFQAEVEIISRVHHRHLVSLVGYCIADGQRMLVYEFVSNKTLEFHLHGKGQPVMNWQTRLQIALGSAKGLAYLHEDCHPRIIHRDIKAANILLDDNYEAMVADFGLAKLSSDNYTHVSTRVMGTFGYLAPEYASSGKLTEKSDVFSFGVMLLELITGRKPVDPSGTFMEDSLVDWARPLLTQALGDGEFNELVDPRLEGNFVTHEMTRMIACASASIRHSARRRPKMGQIVRALEGDSSLEDLNDGPRSAKSGTTPGSSSNDTQTYDTGMYNADMMKFRKMVMSSSQELNSSEYGDTSDYGLHPSASSSDEFGRRSSVHQDKKP